MCLNLFLVASAISCLDMNGNDRNFATLLLSVLFLPPALLVLSTPSCKSKSRLGFNDGHSWSLGQALIATGGALLGPLPTTLSRLLWDPLPPSHPVWWRAALKHPCLPPIPPHHSVQSVTPPLLCTTTLLCALFVQGRSDPSLCRLNLHTKTQCKNRQLYGCRSRVQPKPAHARALHGSVSARASRYYPHP